MRGERSGRLFFLSSDPRLRTKFVRSRDALVFARRVDGCSNTLVWQCKRIFFVQPGAMPSTFSKARERKPLRKTEIERRRVAQLATVADEMCERSVYTTKRHLSVAPRDNNPSRGE